MFERFTDRTRWIVVLVQDEARGLEHNYTGTGHPLLDLITEGGGVTAKALEMAEVKDDAVYIYIIETIGEGEKAAEGHILFTSRAKRVFEPSLREALQFDHSYIGTGHLPPDLFGEGKGVTTQVLTRLSTDLSQVRETIVRLLPDYQRGGGEDRESVGVGVSGTGEPERQNSAILEQLGRNLTWVAYENKPNPVIGRRIKMRRVMQVLSHRTKNSPILIGESGIDKITVVEGLAQVVVNRGVPEAIRDRQIYSLDTGSLMAGPRYRDSFEKRLKKISKEICMREGTVLFIDEIHTLVGTDVVEGPVDVTQMLRPTLARGELQIIGATTSNEYRKYTEKDAALECRSQPVKADEPSVEETVEILKGLYDRYEAHHRVIITDQAITAAAGLTDRYISDRFLPDKAIDLVGEAGVCLRIRQMTAPPELHEFGERVVEVRRNKELAADDQDSEKTVALRDGGTKLGKTHKAKEVVWKGAEPDEIVEVGKEEIVKVPAMSTGTPALEPTQIETTKPLNMETGLHKYVTGQDGTVEAPSQPVRRIKSGLKDPNRPGGSFIFVGPIGVGKTEPAKALAEFLLGDEDTFIQPDMSGLSEKYTASCLFGTPPGYMGYDEGGQLTGETRCRPSSVALFDEVEKTHPDIFNPLPQILEEGRLTDLQNREANFRNTVIVMMTNPGTRDINKGVLTDLQSADNLTYDYVRMKSKVNEELEQHFRPESLSRVDGMIIFPLLGKDGIKQIVGLMIAGLAKRAEAQDMHLQLSDGVREFLADLGFDSILDARPLRRTIQRKIGDVSLGRIFFGEIQPGQLVLVGVEDEGKGRRFTFSVQQ